MKTLLQRFILLLCFPYICFIWVFAGRELARWKLRDWKTLWHRSPMTWGDV